MRRALLLAVAVIALSACSDATDDEPIEVGGSASPSPEATVSPDPGALLTYAAPKPERPADEFTKASAVAFADYAFQQLYYAYGIPDADEFRSIIDPALCTGCKVFLDNLDVATENQRVIVSKTPISTADGKVTTVDGDFATVRLSVTYPDALLVDKADDSKSESTLEGAVEETVVNLQWIDDQWRLINTQKADS